MWVVGSNPFLIVSRWYLNIYLLFIIALGQCSEVVNVYIYRSLYPGSKPPTCHNFLQSDQKNWASLVPREGLEPFLHFYPRNLLRSRKFDDVTRALADKIDAYTYTRLMIKYTLAFMNLHLLSIIEAVLIDPSFFAITYASQLTRKGSSLRAIHLTNSENIIPQPLAQSRQFYEVEVTVGFEPIPQFQPLIMLCLRLLNPLVSVQT